MKTVHTTLSAAMIKVESLVSKGHKSFKLFREESVWYVIVNGEGK